MSELKFKQWFAKNWNGWLSTYEPRRGGTVGIADIQILIRGRLVPIELKVGTLKNGKLVANDIRPAQIRWHYDLSKAGGQSFFLIGVMEGNDPERAFYCRGGMAQKLTQPIELKEMRELDLLDITEDLKISVGFLLGSST